MKVLVDLPLGGSFFSTWPKQANVIEIERN